MKLPKRPPGLGGLVQGLLGAGLLCTGVALISVPAALIVAGALVLLDRIT